MTTNIEAMVIFPLNVHKFFKYGVRWFWSCAVEGSERFVERYNGKVIRSFLQ